MSQRNGRGVPIVSSSCHLHFPVAIGIAESDNGTLADRAKNTDGIAGTVVDKIKTRLANDAAGTRVRYKDD